MLKIEPLIEQTEFLLEKQQESKQECTHIFADFLETVDQKIKSTKLAEDARCLEKIYTMISEQAQAFEKETQEDIDFLHEQYKTLKQIQAMADKEKAAEILRMAVEDPEEVSDTEKFKKTVNEDLQVSKRNLLVMIDDLRAALAEGSAEEVAGILETMMAEQKDCDCGDECSCCESDDDEEYSDDDEADHSCGSCPGGSCCSDKMQAKKNTGAHDCCCLPDVDADIFAKFNELADTKNKKSN